MRNKVIDMSSQWEDLDQFSLNRLEELSDAIENTCLDLIEDATECVGEVL